MTIYILGMGAIGSFFGTELRLNGQDIIGLCRGSHFEAIQSYGLNYTKLDGSETTISLDNKFQVFQDLKIQESGFAQLQPQDWIVITSKVYSLEYLIRYYSDVIHNHGSIVLIQNGIGNEEMALNLLPNIRVYRILTTNGTLLLSPGKVQHTGLGYTKIGYPQSNTQSKSEEKISSLVEIFQGTSIHAEFEPNIDVMLWEEIFVNIGINAIASIHQIPNGKLVESDEYKLTMRKAITEAWEVARAMKVNVSPTPDKYIEFTYSVCEKTKPNRNSMLQDLDKGKPTEIDYINGIIVQYGKRLGLKTPVNEDLTQKIKKLERLDVFS